MFSVHPLPPADVDPRRYWRGFVAQQKITPYILHRVWSPCIWNGGRRREMGFQQASWGALDFDDGSYTLAQASEEWSGFVHVIGATKSHQVAKNGSKPCDRFRILFPWNQPIRDLRLFRFNMTALVKKYGADEKCVDGARFYWPCSKLVSVNADGASIPIEESVPEAFEKPVTREEYIKKVKFQREVYQDGLPRHIHEFIYNGRLFGSSQSRNSCCFVAARTLLEIGWSSAEIINTLLDTPFSREGFKEREVYDCVASAGRYINSIVNRGVFGGEKRQM